MACQQDRSGTHFYQPCLRMSIFKGLVFKKVFSSAWPSALGSLSVIPDKKDWPGHTSVSGGSVLAGTWRACQESFDLEQPLGPAFCWPDKEQKKGSLRVRILWSSQKCCLTNTGPSYNVFPRNWALFRPEAADMMAAGTWHQSSAV